MATYGVSKAGWIAAHTAVMDLICTGGTPSLKIFTSGSTLLATITLDCAESDVDADGNLTFAVLDQEDAAPNGGLADYGEIQDGSGTKVFLLPCEQGTSPVAGKVVLNTLTIVASAPVSILSVTVPAGATTT